MTSNILNPSEIAKAVAYLQAGSVIAIPTETVYGLAAPISYRLAVNQVFALKNRPTDHPLIIHIHNVDQLALYALEIPDYVYLLAQHFWPGPLTVVLRKSSLVGDWITGGQDTVAIRMPNHPVALALIEQVGEPLAAPSANLFGKISPTMAEHVIDEFGGKVKVLDGGPCVVGIESTIIDATDPKVCTILRSGMLCINELQAVLGSIPVLEPGSTTKQVSGNLKHHYAPAKPCYLFRDQKELDLISSLHPQGISLLAFNERYVTLQPHYSLIAMPSDPKSYAQRLYQTLRQADEAPTQAIAIQSPPTTLPWRAISDRLSKSTAKCASILSKSTCDV